MSLNNRLSRNNPRLQLHFLKEHKESLIEWMTANEIAN